MSYSLFPPNYSDTSAINPTHSPFFLILGSVAHEASSRSHCILELHFPSGAVDSVGSASGSVPGLLRIVDLAGSERNFETQMHSRSMAERGGLINYSLLMLKECARRGCWRTFCGCLNGCFSVLNIFECHHHIIIYRYIDI